LLSLVDEKFRRFLESTEQIFEEGESDRVLAVRRAALRVPQSPSARFGSRGRILHIITCLRSRRWERLKASSPSFAFFALLGRIPCRSDSSVAKPLPSSNACRDAYRTTFIIEPPESGCFQGFDPTKLLESGIINSVSFAFLLEFASKLEASGKDSSSLQFGDLQLRLIGFP
jgi:hypothetical protein